MNHITNNENKNLLNLKIITSILFIFLLGSYSLTSLASSKTNQTNIMDSHTGKLAFTIGIFIIAAVLSRGAFPAAI